MDTILVTGGQIPQYKYVKHLFKDRYVCVADSGFDWVIQNSVCFDKLVGDMDSLKYRDEFKKLSEDKYIEYPQDKDDTDTIIGLKLLKALGPKSITIIGGGGGRLDHLLGIVSLFDTDLSPDAWYTHREIVIKVKGHITLAPYLGLSISIYPLNKVDCSIDSYGLKWDLANVDWKYRSIGISNYVNSANAWLDSGDSVLLLIIPITGKGFE